MEPLGAAVASVSFLFGGTRHGYSYKMWKTNGFTRFTWKIICKYRVPTSMAGWWFQPFFIFHHIWDVILPIDFHMFQDGYCTTNQMAMFTRRLNHVKITKNPYGGMPIMILKNPIRKPGRIQPLCATSTSHDL